MFDYEIDNLTLTLLLAIVATLLYSRIAKPSPLAHPLLLGKQAEVSAVRKEGESGVYRSFATGHGTPFVIRPANTLKTLADIVQADNGKKGAVQQTILDVPLTNEALRELIRLLPLGLKAQFHLNNVQETGPILVLLPPGPSTALPLLLLALASQSSRPLIILPSPRLLITALKAENGTHARPSLVVTHESIAEGVIEQVAEVLRGKCAVLVAGDMQKRLVDTAKEAGRHGVEVAFWEDLWEAAEGQKDADEAAPNVNDVHSFFYSVRGDGAPEVTKFTHLTFTAGIAGLLALFPADKRPSSARRDVVASAVPLTTPIGLTIALASIWSGAGFRLIGPPEASWDAANSSAADLQALTEGPRSDRPSIIFGTAQHHEAITSDLHQAYRGNALAKLVSGSKLNDLANGHISRDSIWDKLVWRSLRNNAIGGLAGDRLRALIIVGGKSTLPYLSARLKSPNAPQLSTGNLLLSLPTSRISSSPLSAGPLTVSHFYDLQGPVPDLELAYTAQPGEASRVGAPANNVELVLRDVSDGALGGKVDSAVPSFGAAEAIRGRLHARGPALGTVSDSLRDADGWVNLGAGASVSTNGTFSIVSPQ